MKGIINMNIRKKLQIVAATLLVAFGLFAVPVAVVVPSASAQQSTMVDCAKQGTNFDFNNIDANGCGGNKQLSNGPGGRGIEGTIKRIINFFSVLVAVVSVIMIIWGGFKYVTSGGESNNVSSAKNTIIYALVGLVIVALAQFIVQFVLKSLF